MERLRPIGEDIWLAEGDCVSFYGFAYPTRSVIVRLRSGDLWFWSLIAFNPNLKSELDAIGTVRFLVSPNKIHHLFLGDWQDAYPDAAVWGTKSTADKRPDLRFAGTLADEAPPGWRNEIAQFWVRGSPALDEVVFFHRQSRTLIFADLSENFSAAFLQAHWAPWQRAIARIWKIVAGWGYAPLEWRLSFFDKSHLRRAKAHWLELDPENVIMAHGECQFGKGRAYIERAFAWV
ncbi:DUF4336 domain-containing protein [Croceicoccus estronivorus]|uniref:DUF4336 domain-containing protein n=1 Tax=Croceicoccus estronivorus TaxID=1172626 RepID=UPI000837A1EC|nr:DUF4336 domain-containing protein [Croceicoccus estronivorus]OCC22521.1 DUF4336 domain-containing protein [Croceicoccus estronivorus]